MAPTNLIALRRMPFYSTISRIASAALSLFAISQVKGSPMAIGAMSGNAQWEYATISISQVPSGCSARK
jgi:hypothetical protein